MLPLCVRAQWFKRVGVSGRLLLEVCVWWQAACRVFSWAGVGGLRVCFPGSGHDLSLMWGLPGRGCFFTPRRSVFLESHGHSFVPRNWPQICGCFWVCERIALFMGRPPHCRARNLAPHSGPLFLNKTMPFVLKSGGQDVSSDTQLHHLGVLLGAWPRRG